MKFWRACTRPATSLALALLAFLTGIEPLLAHHRAGAPDGPIIGLAIPDLTHGQMVVIAENRAAILALASQRIARDSVKQRLENFVNLQYFACFWGLAPGSVTDEASPFNECAHAYLAGTKALLAHLQTMPGDRAPVKMLIEKIEREMLENSASLALCRYSDETFDTAVIISPRWSDIPQHPASLATLIGAPLGLVGCAWLSLRFWRRRKTG